MSPNLVVYSMNKEEALWTLIKLRYLKWQASFPPDYCSHKPTMTQGEGTANFFQSIPGEVSRHPLDSEVWPVMAWSPILLSSFCVWLLIWYVCNLSVHRSCPEPDPSQWKQSTVSSLFSLTPTSPEPHPLEKKALEVTFKQRYSLKIPHDKVDCSLPCPSGKHTHRAIYMDASCHLQHQGGSPVERLRRPRYWTRSRIP